MHQHTPDGRQYLDFRYLTIRVWEQPVDDVLASDLGTLPLAPIAAGAADTLPAIIRRMDNRIQAEAAPREAATLWAATYILMGLRYPPEMAEQLLRGVRDMRESSTYQAILTEGREEGREQGRVEEARAILLRLGRKHLGPPDERVRETIMRLSDHERLEELSERVTDVASWAELLADA